MGWGIRMRLKKRLILLIFNIIFLTGFINAYEIRLVRVDPLHVIRYLGWISNHEVAYCIHGTDNIVVYKDLQGDEAYEKLKEFSEWVSQVKNDNSKEESFIITGDDVYLINKETLQVELLATEDGYQYNGSRLIPENIYTYNFLVTPSRLSLNRADYKNYGHQEADLRDSDYNKIFSTLGVYKNEEGPGYLIIGSYGTDFYEVQFEYPEIKAVIPIVEEYGYVDIKKLDEDLYLGMFYREDVESDDEYSRCSLRVFNREGEIFLDYKDYLLVNSHGIGESFYLSPDRRYIIATGSKTLGNHKTLIFELIK